MDMLRKSYAARAESVGDARRDVTAFASAAGAGTDALQAIRLAVSEALTNAVLHGYRGATGEVQVLGSVDRNALSIAVRDGGVGLGRAPVRPGLGCGLEVIAAVADEMSVGPAPRGGTELRMRFALSAQPLVAAAA